MYRVQSTTRSPLCRCTHVLFSGSDFARRVVFVNVAVVSASPAVEVKESVRERERSKKKTKRTEGVYIDIYEVSS